MSHLSSNYIWSFHLLFPCNNSYSYLAKQIQFFQAPPFTTRLVYGILRQNYTVLLFNFLLSRKTLFNNSKMECTVMQKEEEEEENEETFHSPLQEIITKKTKKDDETNGDEETIKLSLMRTIVVNKLDPPPSSKDNIDDLTLRRFLRARDLDVEKASSMFVRYLEWRRSFVPKGSISESEITNEIAQNKMFVQGSDKQGRPIAVVFGSRHFACKGGCVDEFRRFLVFALDKLCHRMPEGQEKFTIIGDLKGYGYCNSDLRGNLAAITIQQEYYPERLGKLFVINAPYVFMTMWKIVCPFIDKNTRKKIVFVENKRLRETLLEDIDESQLPDIYGGKLKLVPVQNG